MDIQPGMIKGLMMLVQGAQTDPQGTAMKAAMSPVDPMMIQQLLEGAMFPQQPPLAGGGQQSGFEQVLYGRPFQNTPQQLVQPRQEGFTPSPLPVVPQQPKTTTLPEVGPTAPALPQGSPWQMMKPEELPQVGDNAGWDQVMKTGGAAPGLTPEQMAKIAGMIPRGAVQRGAGGNAPSGHPTREIRVGQLSVPQQQAAPSLAAILRGGR